MNKMMIRLTAMLFFVFIVFVSVHAMGKKPGKLNDILATYGASFTDIGDMPVIDEFRFTAKGRDYHRITGDSQGIRIEVEVIDSLPYEKAETYKEAKYRVAREILEKKQILYPGLGPYFKKDRGIEGEKPKEVSAEILGSPAPAIILDVTENYIFRTNEQEPILSRAVYGIAYDETKQVLYQITVFQPADTFDQDKALGILKGFVKTK